MSTKDKTNRISRISRMLIVFLIVAISSIVPQSASAKPNSEIQLDPGDLIENSRLGRSIAIDGNLVVVGAPEASEEEAFGVGAAYIFKRHGNAYVLEAKLIAPDPTLGSEFGRAVAVEGNTIVVGARFATSGDVERAGAAYIFRYMGGSWIFDQKLTASDVSAEDNFGRAVALHGDLLVVTARKEEVSEEDEGAAYVFRRTGASWTEEAKLTASDGTIGARFGQSVAIVGNNLIAVGARDADSPTAKACGAVYIFQRIADEWVETAKLTASDGAKGDQFAFNLATHGNVIVVGSRRSDPQGLKDAGAVYIFSKTKSGWTETAKLMASDAKGGDEFGHSVAMDGNFIAVGARRADIDTNPDQGAVYLFRRADNQWVETTKLLASNGGAGDEFGHSLSAHGNAIAVGAQFADVPTCDEGAAYVFKLNSTK
ncbi:MAG: hypothetical protein PHD13_07205 [Methanocellales archaeon]|nr:hypothetical protein [Methanocellales archaeon]MDD3292282.1 hypothetical protein [Methanocellales archaeon]MDD5235944.1 hypothetical protein [Methanocellales archaeon]MDD5485832.1 hypothetical protein [Methanocellales archaeon]